MFRKKWLASILSVMMVFAFLPISSFALTDAEAAGNNEPVVEETTEKVVENTDSKPAPEADVEEPAAEPEEEIVEEAPMMLAATAAPELKAQGNKKIAEKTTLVNTGGGFKSDYFNKGDTVTVDGLTATVNSQGFVIKGDYSDRWQPGDSLEVRVNGTLVGYAHISKNGGISGSNAVYQMGYKDSKPEPVDQYAYTIKYYKDSFQNEPFVTDVSAAIYEAGEEVSISQLEIAENTPDNYEFSLTDPANGTITISAEGENVIKVLYVGKEDPVTYTATFDMHGCGNQVPPQSGLKAGDKVTKPEDPKADGFDFKGWFTDGTYETQYDFDTKITGDVTIHAKWVAKDIPVEYVTVAFNMHGHGNQVDLQVKVVGQTADKPVDPSAEGWVFGGWYTDGSFTTPYDFDTQLEESITLHALWTEKPDPTTLYKVTYDANGGSFKEGVQHVFPDLELNSETPTPATEPTRDGYNFVGWEPEVVATVTGNATYVAKWTPVGPGPNPPGPNPPGPNPPGPTPGPTPTPGGGGGGAVVPGAGAVIAAAAAPAAATQIQDQEAPKGLVDLGAWALLNLLLTILTCIMSVCLIITYFTRKKEDEEENAAYAEEQEEEKLKKKGLWRLISAAWGILMIIVFFLTEDMSLPMVFTDKWTILMIVMTVIQAGIMIMSRKKYDEEDEDAQMA